jgi:hypothetical protein
MWALLSDPGHAQSFDDIGGSFAPLRRLVEQLAGREYAGQVYAFESLASFNLTTAPTRPESVQHEGFGIEYDPGRGVFRIGYSERSSPTRQARLRTPPVRDCDPQEVEEVIDRYVQRLLLSRPPAIPEWPVLKSALVLVMFAAMFVYLVFWTLLWTGLPVGRLACASIGVVILATALISIGEALLPRWERPWWRRVRPGRSTVRMGRLVLLGSGIWFGTGGTVFLWCSLIGELPRHAVWLFLSAMAVGFVLFMVGLKLDRRRLEAAWASEDAQQSAGSSAEPPSYCI